MESANFWTKKKGQELFEQALQFDADGKVAEAVEAYQKSLEECPRNAQAHYNLGVALATDGKISQALRSWQRALWLEPAFRLELIKAFDIADELAEEVICDHEEFAPEMAKAA